MTTSLSLGKKKILKADGDKMKLPSQGKTITSRWTTYVDKRDVLKKII